ncbi:MAG: hypothetical protein RL189_806 [Pseudomonadota bacterium]|jgi:hypothetical protein
MTLKPTLQRPSAQSKGSKSSQAARLLVCCIFTFVMQQTGCIQQGSGPVKKIKGGEKPAAPLPTSTPQWAQFAPNQLYSALRKTYLKTKAIDSAKLYAAQKCEIEEGTQIVLKAPPAAPVNKHWQVELQLKLPGCNLEAGFLFTDHWKQSQSTGGNTTTDSCGHPAEMDFALGSQLAQEANRVNIGAFTSRCYEYAGIAIENVGLMPKGAGAWSAAGVPTESAADFVKVENSSKAANFVRLRPSSWGCLPEGTIVVWDRGVCGFNATHGHIEIVVSQNSSNPSQTRLCSDGCQTLQTSCSIQSGVSFFFPRKRF